MQVCESTSDLDKVCRVESNTTLSLRYGARLARARLQGQDANSQATLQVRDESRDHRTSRIFNMI